ncbi:uncharacterized protein LOC110738893 [Chenopodium quinoa]|uniref:uncharacterized protein LOC110738893 n=1 Tax=Chenopodium quinoa TaxID=63459 RepID=UPI000B784155|nr:uncharacterized protein LOC110738893 [Chenopodium quinoa]
MGNYLALCTIGDIQSKEALLKEERILQIIKKVDGKVLEFTNPISVRDLLVSYPNSYVGIFKDATQPLPLDHKLKIGKVYYLLPSLDPTTTTTTTTTKTTIKVVITKEQLQQILSKQGSVEDFLLGVVPKKDLSSKDCSVSSSTWIPKLESIPEGNNDVVC